MLIPATNLTRDVYQRYIHPGADENQVLLISRGLVLVLGIIAFLLVSQFKTVLNAAFTAYNIYGTSITPALLAAFLWKRATAVGALASIVTGTSVTLIWTYVLPDWNGFTNMHPFYKSSPTRQRDCRSWRWLRAACSPRAPKETWEPFFNDED